MDRLKYVLIPSGVFPVLAGGFLIVALSLGYYTWPVIVGAVALGAVLTLPVAHLVSRRIKREDPNFNHRRNSADGVLPDPTAREV
ncbi:hypothetical protein M8756_05555 [Lutimaribacter sp. EGI FJ00015]|uniref:Uncharacterized protein n=1 Tax=Lutimaribacter degradans TaxID=2945989 RepID=A0ACC5ZVV9_9RHOB|nr:hypothetical protein [Lutimaribacter sp. EGI FJ00013]MCM2561524.1 hypothetical protein [Lutimaribacter sp. EGI FJ00013]MCO0612765.1 hypothetical protein [Lutimaribacter sp. EGI FJ00015]MCO0635423.1 hypothetical protein [Lutimaribacter sp. EGI FJ00014]